MVQRRLSLSEDDFYDKYYLDLTRVRALITGSKENWRGLQTDQKVRHPIAFDKFLELKQLVVKSVTMANTAVCQSIAECAPNHSRL